MEAPLLIIIAIKLIIAFVLMVAFRNKGNTDIPILQSKVGELQTIISRIESDLNNKFSVNKSENAENTISRVGASKSNGKCGTGIMVPFKTMTKLKKEFENVGGMLEKAQKNIQTGLGQLDDVVVTRTRAIHRQLRNVESLPAVETQIELPEIILSTDDKSEN